MVAKKIKKNSVKNIKKTPVKKDIVKAKKFFKKDLSKKSKIFFGLITIALLLALIFGIISFFPCYKREKFAITSKKGDEKIILKLEIADTNEARIKGLMNREVLNKNTGMLFDFEKPDYYSMWMKNTLIPLDMIFFNEKGKVIKTAHNRKPMSEDLINPCSIEFENSLRVPGTHAIDVDKFFEKCENKYLKPRNLVRYVIEVPAGTVKEAKIRVGDILIKK